MCKGRDFFGKTNGTLQTVVESGKVVIVIAWDEAISVRDKNISQVESLESECNKAITVAIVREVGLRVVVD